MTTTTSTSLLATRPKSKLYVNTDRVKANAVLKTSRMEKRKAFVFSPFLSQFSLTLKPNADNKDASQRRGRAAIHAWLDQCDQWMSTTCVWRYQGNTCGQGWGGGGAGLSRTTTTMTAGWLTGRSACWSARPKNPTGRGTLTYVSNVKGVVDWRILDVQRTWRSVDEVQRCLCCAQRSFQRCLETNSWTDISGVGCVILTTGKFQWWTVDCCLNKVPESLSEEIQQL